MYELQNILNVYIHPKSRYESVKQWLIQSNFIACLNTFENTKTRFFSMRSICLFVMLYLCDAAYL
jgi:hypothetical protein